MKITKNTHRGYHVFCSVTVACAVGLGACHESESVDSGTSNVEVAGPPPLDAQSKADLYHLSIGSEFLPYFLVKALLVTGPDGKSVPFLSEESLARFNILPDAVSPLNPEGLPVGFTLGKAKDTGLTSIGINCSACHVGEIQYTAADNTLKTLRIDGGPNVADIRGFVGELVNALKAEAVGTNGFLDQAEFVVRAIREYVEVEQGTNAEARARAALAFLGGMLLRSLGVESGSPEEFVDSLDFPLAQKRLLLARIVTLQSIASRTEDTPSGFGRTDAFGLGKNTLFAHLGVSYPTTAPVSFPCLFNMETKALYHSNHNSNSVIHRNLITAIALGGVVDQSGDTPTFETTANILNIGRIEKAAYRIRPPEWPADVPRDGALAARGAEVYRANCQGCHEPTVVGRGLYFNREFAPDEVGTDLNQAVNFDAVIKDGPNVETGKRLADRLLPLLNAIEARYYDENHVSLQDQLVLGNRFDAELNPKGLRDASMWRSTLTATGKAYTARSLDGEWATAPFLHNGSVPTLADLLKPAAERPKKFWLGTRKYDLENVGYRVILEEAGPVPAENATFLFDTTVPGNSNQGHEFGTQLPSDDKKALLEWMKGLGGGATRPIILPKK